MSCGSVKSNSPPSSLWCMPQKKWGVNNIGNGVTAFNYYMIIGGTN